MHPRGSSACAEGHHRQQIRGNAGRLPRLQHRQQRFRIGVTVGRFAGRRCTCCRRRAWEGQGGGASVSLWSWQAPEHEAHCQPIQAGLADLPPLCKQMDPQLEPPHYRHLSCDVGGHHHWRDPGQQLEHGTGRGESDPLPHRAWCHHHNCVAPCFRQRPRGPLARSFFRLQRGSCVHGDGCFRLHGCDVAAAALLGDVLVADGHPHTFQVLLRGVMAFVVVELGARLSSLSCHP
mmetsp:Transcript_19494/g.46539  ORF Transcript_19494/g.46539 Transcript_19494/m.46539 type:complete len:234 (-) Transcript_19494:893-1594(-)